MADNRELDTVLDEDGYDWYIGRDREPRRDVDPDEGAGFVGGPQEED